MSQAPDNEKVKQVFATLPCIYRSIQASRLKIAKDSGVSRNQMDLLSSLGEHGPQSLTTLAHSMAIAKPNITTMVNELETEGLVCRTGNGQDKRVVLINLTEQGIAFLSESRIRWRTEYQSALAGLSSDELSILLEGLKVLDKFLNWQTTSKTK